jgi:molybdopterin-guanine dinucleotide biosynthesis protein A
MKYPCSGIILSGGLNTRMGGKDKAFLSVGNKTILDRLYNTLQGLFDEVLLVTNNPLQYLSWDLTIVTDLFPIRSPLTGIHAGLFHASAPHAFITACDTPFLKKKLIMALLDEVEPKWDVVIPVTEEGNQPLCAIYSKRCIKPIERQLKNEEPKIMKFFPRVKVKEITEAQLRSADPHLVSFLNINTPEDLTACEKILTGSCPNSFAIKS